MYLCKICESHHKLHGTFDQCSTIRFSSFVEELCSSITVIILSNTTFGKAAGVLQAV